MFIIIVQEYNRIMEIKHVRGATTGKHRDLQLLAKQWWITAKKENGEVDLAANWNWQDATFYQTAWGRKVQTFTQSRPMVGWGEAIGIYRGEKNARKALKSGELKAKMVMCEDGQQRKMFERWNVTGTDVVTNHTYMYGVHRKQEKWGRWGMI